MAQDAHIMTDEYLGPERRHDNALLGMRLDALHGDVGEIKSTLKSLSDAIMKLALVEERQAQASAAIERAFGSVARVDAKVSATEKRLVELEKVVPAYDRTSQWVDRAVWAGLGLLGMYAAKAVGLL